MWCDDIGFGVLDLRIGAHSGRNRGQHGRLCHRGATTETRAAVARRDLPSGVSIRRSVGHVKATEVTSWCATSPRRTLIDAAWVLRSRTPSPSGSIFAARPADQTLETDHSTHYLPAEHILIPLADVIQPVVFGHELFELQLARSVHVQCHRDVRQWSGRAE